MSSSSRLFHGTKLHRPLFLQRPSLSRPICPTLLSRASSCPIISANKYHSGYYNSAEPSLAKTMNTPGMKTSSLPGSTINVTQEIADKLKTYSAMTPTSLSMSELLEHGRRKCKMESFQFLRMCLPIRLANMIMELQCLPYELTKQPQFQEILHAYLKSFIDILKFELADNNALTHEKFMEFLIWQRKQHANTVPTMAAAMKGMIREFGTSDAKTFQYFLDRLYLNRISTHLLISNYRELHSNSPRAATSLIGIIDPDCDVVRSAQSAYEDASFMCDREYLEHPNLNLQGFEVDYDTKEVREMEQVNLSYIPSHLHHIFFEIFKNAMRATCEVSQKYNMASPSDIDCIIYKSKNDVTIKISDVGGGITRWTVNHVFDYQYTTAEHLAKTSCNSGWKVGLQSEDHPMHGLGYGLPLSRLYARYFQGDLKIASVDGYGTDVYIYLQTLSEDATEHLPNFSQAAVHKLKPKLAPEGDWIDKLQRN